MFSALRGRVAERADPPDGPRWAPPRQTSAAVRAVGQADRSARWHAFWPAARSPMLQTPASRWLRAPSSSPEGCTIGQRAYCRPWYSSSPMSLQHADATGSGTCPDVARRLVGPVSIPAAKHIAVFSSCRQSSSDFCAISIMVWARGPGILWRRAQKPTSSIAQ